MNISPLVAAALLALAVWGCTPSVGINISNAPTIPDCTPGSAARPCR